MKTGTSNKRKYYLIKKNTCIIRTSIVAWAHYAVHMYVQGSGRMR